MPVSQGVWSYVTQSEIPVLNKVKGRIECIAPGKGNHGPVKVDGTYNLNMLTERVIIQLELLLMIGCMWQVTSLIRL